MRHPVTALRVVLSLTVLAIAVPVSSAQPAVAPLAAASDVDLAEGKRWFDSQCALCHGIAGTGGSGPLLQRSQLRSATNDDELVSVVWRGIPGTDMPSSVWGFTERVAWQVAAYVRSLGRVQPETPRGDPAAGVEVYAARNCSSCHVIDGEGQALGPELTQIGATRGLAHLRQALVDPNASLPGGHVTVRATTRDAREIQGVRLDEDVFWLHLRDARGTRHSFRKADLVSHERQLDVSLMPSYASILSESELDDLVSYLSSLRGER